MTGEVPSGQNLQSPVDIDGLIAAIEFYEDSDRIDEHVFHTVPIEHPEVAVELYTRLAASEYPGIRRGAASGLHHVLNQDFDAGMGLWEQLIADDSTEVRAAAVEAVQDAPEQKDPQLDMETLIRIAKLGNVALHTEAPKTDATN